jgi:hypothetical protein
VKGADPAGTLECPPGYVLDESLGMCRPDDPVNTASMSSGDNFVRLEDIPKELRPDPKKVNKKKETAAPFRPDAKMERCIRDVKANLGNKNPKFKGQSVKSAAIAICRSRLKE